MLTLLARYRTNTFQQHESYIKTIESKPPVTFMPNENRAALQLDLHFTIYEVCV